MAKYEGFIKKLNRTEKTEKQKVPLYFCTTQNPILQQIFFFARIPTKKMVTRLVKMNENDYLVYEGNS